MVKKKAYKNDRYKKSDRRKRDHEEREWDTLPKDESEYTGDGSDTTEVEDIAIHSMERLMKRLEVVSPDEESDSNRLDLIYRELMKKSDATVRRRVLNILAEQHVTDPISSYKDRHSCYHASVQIPKEEVHQLERMYRVLAQMDSIPGDDRVHQPLVLREDFCGSAVLCSAWCKSYPLRTAIGVDIDLNVLEYANQTTLLSGSHVSRLQLFHGSVLEAYKEWKPYPHLDDPKDTLTIQESTYRQADIIAGLNYGIFYFHERDDLIKYLRQCREEGLSKNGIMVVDCFGGSQVYSSSGRFITRKIGEAYEQQFLYSFNQEPLNFHNNQVRVTLSFLFEDGSCLPHAYEYKFRVYSLKEIREAMKEAGFSETHVWLAPSSESCWKGKKKSTNEDDGVFMYNKLNETDELSDLESFNAYVVGVQ